MAANKDVFDVLIAAGNGLARLLGKEPQLMRIPPLEIAPVMPHLSVPSHVFLEATRASAHATIVPASAPDVTATCIFESGAFDISGLFSGIFSGFWLLLLVLLALLFVRLVFWAVDKRASRPSPAPYVDGSAQTLSPPPSYSNSSAQTTKVEYADKKAGPNTPAPLYKDSSFQTRKATYVDQGHDPETPESSTEDDDIETEQASYVDMGVQTDTQDPADPPAPPVLPAPPPSAAPNGIDLAKFLKIAGIIDEGLVSLLKESNGSLGKNEKLSMKYFSRDPPGGLSIVNRHRKDLTEKLEPELEGLDDQVANFFRESTTMAIDYRVFHTLFKFKRAKDTRLVPFVEEYAADMWKYRNAIKAAASGTPVNTDEADSKAAGPTEAYEQGPKVQKKAPAPAENGQVSRHAGAPPAPKLPAPAPAPLPQRRPGLHAEAPVFQPRPQPMTRGMQASVWATPNQPKK